MREEEEEEDKTDHHHHSSSEVDIDHMESLFGNSTVQVTPCCFKTDNSTSNKKGEEEPHAAASASDNDDNGLCIATEMTFSQYCSWWRGTKDDDDDDDHCQHRSTTTPASLLYLKDWHLPAEYPDYHAYQCPAYFQDDWLNEWLDDKNNDKNNDDDGGGGGGICSRYKAKPPPPIVIPTTTIQPSCVTTSDYRFLYLGPAGTNTPLHADVVRSSSWSANVIGRKMWRLLPPEYVGLLYDSTGTTVAPCFYNNNNNNNIGTIVTLQGRKYPKLKEATKYIITVYQEEGETIFVPSGWYHEVVNITDVVSINHNWFNAHNGGKVWRFLQWERREAARLIEDCRELLLCSDKCSGRGKDWGEFEGLVQRNMGLNCGFTYTLYGELLRFIAGKALSKVGGEVHGDGGWVEEEWETLYRLQQIGLLLEQLIAEEEEEEDCRAFYVEEIESNRRVLEKMKEEVGMMIGLKSS